nr:unnamed protein product [Callosobruchus chinensis]
MYLYVEQCALEGNDGLIEPDKTEDIIRNSCSKIVYKPPCVDYNVHTGLEEALQFIHPEVSHITILIVNDPVTYEDSGEEKNVVMYSLPGSQLRAECKFSNYDQQWDSDDEKPLSNFVKRKPKKIKKFSFSKRILHSNLQTWIQVRTVKNQQSPASLFTLVFDDAIIDMIVSYSNLYVQQTWEDIFH